MNENNEKNSNVSSGESPEPLTKKVARFSAIIYLCLAIAVVVVATVGIFSISYDYNESIPPVSFPELDFSPESSQTPPDEPSKPEIPVGGEESGVDAELSEPEPEVMFYRPVSGEIIKGFSMDALVFSETMKDYRVHSGVHIQAELGSDVVAYSNGVISSVTEDYFYGVTVSITHDEGAISYYMNLDPALAEIVSVGNEVLAGQIIGKVGNTARIESADPPHLHFELRFDGELVDPESELPEG